MKYTQSYGFTARLPLAYENTRTRIIYFLICFQNVWTEKAASSNSETRYGNVQRFLVKSFQNFTVLWCSLFRSCAGCEGFVQLCSSTGTYSDARRFFRSMASFVIQLATAYNMRLWFCINLALFAVLILLFCSQTRSVSKKEIFCT